jgi:outer membrane receptor protein involved in Fe transport
MLFPWWLAAQPDQPQKLEPVKTSITVVERISAETPANVSVIDSRDLRETPGVDLDDRLRDVPGFTLFRRTSSLVAHPTTQGVSLRGLGSSGASRTLVLWDGIPVNDPFGGWVYWSRFTPDELERIEVSRGASTSIFGDRAMAGVIAIVARAAERRHLLAGYQGGNKNSHDAWLGASNLWSRWAISGSGRAFTTDGYFIVPERIRGSVDRRAGLRFATGAVRLDWFGGANRIFLKSDVLAEDRKNGTSLQTNSTGLGEVGMHYDREVGRDNFSVLGFHTRDQFHSSFSAIPANRNSETITFRQTVPSEATGGAALWQHTTSRWNLLGGADVYRTEGFNTDAFPTIKRVAGGTLLQHGVFAQSDVTLGWAKLFVGGRHSFAGQDRTFFSPSAGIIAGRHRWRGRASVYRSFRAPTLNELYREFRVGNTITQGNLALRPETVFGAEVGADFVGESTGVRVTFYRNSLHDLITNVTLSSSPAQIVRQRQNAAAALSRGAEMEARGRWKTWRGELGYLYVNSRYATGELLPQVPRHQGSAQLSFEKGGTLASAGVRSYGAQFDDDLNRFRLHGFATVQLVARQRLAKGLSASVAFENLLDREYIVALTPTPSIGAPRLWRIGLRWEGKLP